LVVPIGHKVQASARVFPVAPAFAKYPAVQVFAVKVRHDPPLPVVYEPAEQIVQEVLPVLTVVKPAVQGVHDSALPAADFDVPTGQKVQASVSVLAVAPAFANLPAGQISDVKVKHDPPLPVVYEPAEQIVQEVLPVLTVVKPAVQGVHDAVFPAADLDVPIGHTVQASFSVSATAPAFANLPAGHVVTFKVVQDDALEAPVVELNEPAAQRVHEVWPVND